MIRYFKSNQNYVEDLKVCTTEAEGQSYPCLPNESWKWLEIEQDEFVKLEMSAQRVCSTCGASTWANAIVVHGKGYCTNCGVSFLN